MFPLGAYDLLERVASGSMSQVWRAEHRPDRQVVAVKVVDLGAERDPDRLRAVAGEVRAAATLDHPHVVKVYDQGTVSPADSDRSGGALPAGCPFVVMEYCPGGSLRRLCGQTPWERQRATLVGLLTGLAHAHARGVIHRDIKPDNVVLSQGGQLPKLTDFGVAAAIAHGEATGQPVLRAGTPLYMAPEQIEGTWRDQGPWTDLYALGALAWALATGAAPFAHLDSVSAVAQAQLVGAIPPLAPASAVPAELEAWLLTLLAKSPARRFQRAADARAALLAMGAPDPRTATAGGAGALPREGAAATITVEPPRPVGAPRRRARVSTRPPESPGGPRPWTSDFEDTHPWPARRTSPGLGLFGLRSVPLVGRSAEKRVLWEALGRTCRKRQPQVVVLRGPAGSGKSHLARWLCERGHELGIASVVKADHAPTMGPREGLGTMLARELRCIGLGREQARSRVAQWLRDRDVDDLHEVAALTQLVRAHGQGSDYRFGTRRERLVLVQRTLERLAEERPLIVWLDDVQWGPDALELAQEFAAGRHEDTPILVVATAQDEVLAEAPATAALLGAMARAGRGEELLVGPLDPSAHGALLRELLGLSPQLATLVEERTAGSPLFATQLVGDWVARGLLEPTAHGYRLREGAEVAVPDDLHAVWSERIDETLSGLPLEAELTLELAAALGLDIERDEWAAVCEQVDLAVSDELVERLLARRLWRSRDRRTDAWEFVHPMLRESLERRAREAGRWEAHNRACASMLQERAAGTQPRRLARHLIEGGWQERALDPLLEAAERLNLQGEYRRATAVLADREAIAAAVELDEADPRWGLGWLAAGAVAFRSGRREEAGECVERAREAAAEHGWAKVTAEVGHLEGQLTHEDGRMAHALDLYERTAARAEELGLLDLHLRCLEGVARVLMDLGRDRPAEDQLGRAIRAREAAGQVVRASQSRLNLAYVAIRAGRLGEAETQIDTALRCFEQHGARGELGGALNNAGELARARGDLELAERRYREALSMQRLVGAASALVTELNLGLILQAREKAAAAREIFTHALDELERQGLVRFLGAVHVELTACAAALGDWEAFDRHVAEGQRRLDETGFADKDTADGALRAATLARDAGMDERARAAEVVAVEQRRRLGL